MIVVDAGKTQHISITATSEWWQIQGLRFRKTELGSYCVRVQGKLTPVRVTLLITLRGGRVRELLYKNYADANRICKMLDTSTGLTNDRTGRRGSRPARGKYGPHAKTGKT